MEVLEVREIKTILSRFAFGYLNKDSVFFKNGNACLPNLQRHGVVRDYDDTPKKEQKT